MYRRSLFPSYEIIDISLKKTNYYFKRQTVVIIHKVTWTSLRKGNLKRETESLIVAAQNIAIRTNYVKGKIDNMLQNSKCRLCGDRDERVNHIISKCSKLAQKEYKARYDSVKKVTY